MIFSSRATELGGVYVPSLYDVDYNDDGTVRSITAREGAPEKVVKRVIVDFDAVPYPTKPVVPSTEVVHDKVSLELFRGCVRGCRFCQAGAYLPPDTRQEIRNCCASGHRDAEKHRL